MRRFVDRAHASGLAVILDAVYNHFGPDGAYFKEFSPDYFTDRYDNDWGERSTSTDPTPRRSASSSSPTPATGSTSSISTACGWTRPSRSATGPSPT
jgi:glycosidase